MNSANKAYYELLNRLWHKGVQEHNQRTNVKTYRIDRAWFLDFNMTREGIPLFGNRKYFLGIAAAEVAWQLLGTKDAKFIMQYAPKLWGKFLAPTDLPIDYVETAYGYRWRKQFGRDQLMLAIDALKNDPTNRQCWVSAWDPSCDGLGQPNQPANIPCPVGFHLNVVEAGFGKSRLNLAVTLRSSDAAVGLPYDTLAYSMLLCLIANSLGLRPGHLSLTLCHVHYYAPQSEIVSKSLIGRNWVDHNLPVLGLEHWDIEDVIQNPHGFVEHCQELSKQFPHQYSPSVEVVA